ncbi:efflux RND transporter permease subunit [Fontisphaera persica]|uniref:efflux RND transporter permease subunit n=1 Tax=Fontisphaera persica TaxID=2974023 RepID=UPI0024BFB545|nr:efflux RND transporter permease subunit [Fontisphaera persica]WCJ59793.1 efflux RND transporter permease subunit [Fontisphaera persica]
MQKLAEICIRRPVFASMIILSLFVVGVAGYLHLGVDRFPAVDLPTVRVSTRLVGASPVEMETQVSQPLEEAINTIEGIKELRSISGLGQSFIIVTFDLSRDIDAAAQDVRDRVSRVVRNLPRDIYPPVVTKADNDLSPVLTMALTGDRSQRELTELADKIVKKQIERSLGVGEVNVIGGLERSINIWVDADRLAAYRIPITAVRQAVERQNANIPGGLVTTAVRESTLRTMGRLTDPKAFNDLVVATRNGSPIRVRDIGWAEDGTKEQRTLARLNGVPTVTLEVMRQTGANTVAVIEGVKERLREVQALLPGDVRVEIIRDQSRYIFAALHEIQRHLVVGSILASLVVLLFMRNWRATVIAAIAIPASVVATFGMMKALNFTLNSVTMLALVLMVGIVIDDAIVVLENIFRFVEEKKLPPFDAAREATREIGLAVMATTFSLVVIFVPVSFMSSISGRFLYQFGLTAAVAVLVSLLVAFTLTPTMSARLLRAQGGGGGEGPKSRRGFYGWLDRHYTALLQWALRHRVLTVVLATCVVASSLPIYKMVRQEYIPTNVDEGEFDVSLLAPEGTSFPAMVKVAEQAEGLLRQVPGIRLVLTSVGGGGFGGVNSARFYVRLAPHEERVFSFKRLLQWPPWRAWQGNYSQREVMQQVRRALRQMQDVRISVRNPQTFSIGGPNFDIDFALLGPDLDVLAEYSERLRLKAPDLGLLDADTTLKLDKPELRVEIDRDRAARLGVDTEHIAEALRIMVGGDERVSRFHDETINEDYDVQVRLSEADRTNATTIARLFVPDAQGRLVRLDNVVRLEAFATVSRVDRLDRQRQVSLRAQVAPGYAQADRIAALREEVAKMNLPPGYSTRVSGRARELETTFQEFIWAFTLSVILMYIILASQFENVLHPFTILLSLPLSVPFALLSLWATDQTINLYSALGILVLFGVVKKNAILQIDHMNQLRATGMERAAAILQANRDRLRPILMTTFTLVAGMVPMVLGSGPGAEERRATGVVVIGGQALCLLLTLVVTPVVYSWLDDLGQWLRRRLTGGG